MSEIVAFRYRYKDALTWVHSTTEPARHPNLIVEPLCVDGDSAAPELQEALRELYAIVRGECPSLLNEDSGGNAELEMCIIDAIAKAESLS